MRTARAIVGFALIIIGAVAIADQASGGEVWWLVAGLAAAAGVGGLVSTARPQDT